MLFTVNSITVLFTSIFTVNNMASELGLCNLQCHYPGGRLNDTRLYIIEVDMISIKEVVGNQSLLMLMFCFVLLLRLSEVDHFQSVLAHPAFQEDPLGAITQHIRNATARGMTWEPYQCTWLPGYIPIVLVSKSSLVHCHTYCMSVVFTSSIDIWTNDRLCLGVWNNCQNITECPPL